MLPRLPTLLLLFPLLAPAALPAAAADADTDVVYTDPAHADEDFPFQGEYRGWQTPLGNVRSIEPVGLQVVALGNGEFDGVKFYGGLPGAGWLRGERYRLHGHRDGGIVQLAGDSYDIVLEGSKATVYSHAGRPIGELQKVGRTSPTMGAAPPPGATVLFDGRPNDLLVNAKITPEGWLMSGADTVGAWNDFRMHAEFRTPYKPLARGQARGNSGFYLQSRYELQVLDSFGLDGVENECGALYRTLRPSVNMCLPPLTWQTYDIDFTAPKFDADGKKVRDMHITVWQNGVLIQNNVHIPDKTGHGQPEGPDPLPIKFQDHKNPVVFRNIWLVDKSQTSLVGAAMLPPAAIPPMAISLWPADPGCVPRVKFPLPGG